MKVDAIIVIQNAIVNEDVQGGVSGPDADFAVR